MKRKSNIFLLFLTVFFLIFSSNVTQAATITLSRPQPAASGKFVASGKYWTYQYDDKTIAKNEFLKIGKRNRQCCRRNRNPYQCRLSKPVSQKDVSKYKEHGNLPKHSQQTLHSHTHDLRRQCNFSCPPSFLRIPYVSSLFHNRCICFLLFSHTLISAFAKSSISVPATISFPARFISIFVTAVSPRYFS